MTKTIKTLLVASTNPVKVNAAKQALCSAFPNIEWQVQGVKAPSGVAEQPMTDAETRLGAVNRVEAIRQQSADFYVAFEGGYDRFHGQGFTFAYIAVSDGVRTQVGRSGTLPLPESVCQQLEAGGELGPVMDRVFNDHNIKQKGGAIGIFTNDLVSRTSIYADTLCLLLAPWLHPEIFGESR